METVRNCAYNATRNALLSERVTVANDSPDPAQLLALVLQGPGKDPESAVWLRPAPVVLELPRLFAFDVAYLDDAQRVVEAGSVGPGTGFPPVSGGIASVLILPDRRLSETGTVAGDLVWIREEAELPALLKAASHSFMERREAGIEVQMGQEQAPPVAFEVIRPSEFVFEPFAGSLIYIPAPVRPVAHSTEYFMTREAPPVAHPVPDQTADNVLAEPLGAASADLHEQDVKPADARRIKPEKKAAPELEAPRFYKPEPIRFFDPAATVEKADASRLEADIASPDEPPPRKSIELPPQLKAAILQMDEQLRREKENSKETRQKKEKAPREKKRKPPREEPPEAIVAQPTETAEPEQEHIPPQPEPMIAAQAVIIASTDQAAQIPEQIAPQSQEMAESPVDAVAEPEPKMAPELPVEGTLEPEMKMAPELPVEATIEPELPVEATVQPELKNAPELPVETHVSAPAALEQTPPIELTQPAIEHVSLKPPTIPVPETKEKSVEPEPRQAPVAAHSEATVETRQAALQATPIAEAPPEIKKPPKPIRKKEPKERLPLAARVQRWLGDAASLSGNRRKGERIALPGLVAFYWSGGAPKPHEIVNISKSGFYLRTKELWSPDTLLRMTLQRPPDAQGAPEQISVLARVVRIDDGGVGHEFVTTEVLEALRARDILPEHGTDKKELAKFLQLH